MEALHKLKKQFGKNINIVSCGSVHGADKIIKKTALEFSMTYLEFTPYYSHHTCYTIEDSWMFGKQFAMKYKFMSNIKFVEYCDWFLLFKNNNESNMVVDDIIKKITKKNKIFYTIT